jgi:hypothetical protein
MRCSEGRNSVSALLAKCLSSHKYYLGITSEMLRLSEETEK